MGIEKGYSIQVLHPSYEGWIIMRKKYVGIALPFSLIKKMDGIVKENKWGYKSRAELAKEGIRTLILKLKEKK